MFCSICKKLSLEEDFIFIQTDPVKGYEVPVCFDCAPEEELKLKWEDADNDDHDQSDSSSG